MAELLDIGNVRMIKTEKKAKEVLNDMIQIAELFGFVKRSIYMDLLGVEPGPIDYKYGWNESMIKEARIVSTKRGYFIEFPRSLPLE